MLVRTYLAPSPVDGLGVFAAEPIAKGQHVWTFDPRFDKLIKKEDLKNAPVCLREYIEIRGYDFHRDRDYILLDVDDAIYMNHSDAPNIDITDVEAGYAVRDIAKGEELFCDYATFMPANFVKDFRPR